MENGICNRGGSVKTGNKNLRPFSEMTPEQRSQLGRKGGIASGKARRAKREQAERLALLQRAQELSYRRDLELLLQISRDLRLAAMTLRGK